MKIGIVNDSVMAVEVLRRIIVTCPEHQVAWCAANGAEAVALCHQTPPDLVLMDLLMPVMDGVEATRRIMKTTPCAILIVTASVTGNSSLVYEAMGAGALDVVATPVLGLSGAGTAANELLRKIDIIGKLIGCSPKSTRRPKPHQESKPPNRPQDPPLIVIGASTGGPQALTTVLTKFPANLPAAVVIVQHMDKKFTHGLATWLNHQVTMPVKIIHEKDRPKKGIILVPSTEYHLIMTNSGSLIYSQEPVDNFYHPSVDVFFQSIVKNWTGKIIGILLTGMGRDGATGLLSLKEEGHHTIAQDEATSVVYGMPKAAMQLNATKEILPIHEIGERIVALLGR
ncbi:MAG: chemotaxis response regulator protein-glutamate methylesterase [Proteobacteria bacterium]|nr:chemotaxis response regulator protein-glutamate methylesterase [Desulfobulbaceae bacterium]MBU4153208.1 chemotaxis response regulator protein-glutamate methylesterase [Pseudomonadota bacterium]